GPESIVAAMPVMATAAAAKGTIPPKYAVRLVAIGMVADLAATEMRICEEPPKNQAIARADAIATTQPTSSATVTGSHMVLSLWTCPNKGTARATVAGPIMNTSGLTAEK